MVRFLDLHNTLAAGNPVADSLAVGRNTCLVAAAAAAAVAGRSMAVAGRSRLGYRALEVHSCFEGTVVAGFGCSILSRRDRGMGWEREGRGRHRGVRVVGSSASRIYWT